MGKNVTTGNIKTWPHRHRFTAEEYNWMAEIGLLNGEPAVELIEGEIIQMAPMGTQHGNVVQRLHIALKTALAGRALMPGALATPKKFGTTPYSFCVSSFQTNLPSDPRSTLTRRYNATLLTEVSPSVTAKV